MRNIIDLKLQQQFIDLSFALALPPKGFSGGWYYRNPTTKSGKSEDELKLTSGDHAMMLEKIQAFPPQFKQLCIELMNLGREQASSLPPMKPSIILVNFYKETSQGLYWHRDNSLQEKASARRGTPVVSVSIGDSCDFEYKMEQEDEAQCIRLNSGDVLIFGGPSRLIYHSVSKIYPKTCPKELVMPQAGRLNLTYRCWDK